MKILYRPSELTIFSPETFVAMNWPDSICQKAVWYDFLLPEVAVNTTRDKASPTISEGVSGIVVSPQIVR